MPDLRFTDAPGFPDFYSTGPFAAVWGMDSQWWIYPRLDASGNLRLIYNATCTNAPSAERIVLRLFNIHPSGSPRFFGQSPQDLYFATGDPVNRFTNEYSSIGCTTAQIWRRGFFGSANDGWVTSGSKVFTVYDGAFPNILLTRLGPSGAVQESMLFPADAPVRCIWGIDDTNVFAAGRNGVILKYTARGSGDLLWTGVAAVETGRRLVVEPIAARTKAVRQTEWAAMVL